jgi:hypothetical protein
MKNKDKLINIKGVTAIYLLASFASTVAHAMTCGEIAAIQKADRQHFFRKSYYTLSDNARYGLEELRLIQTIKAKAVDSQEDPSDKKVNIDLRYAEILRGLSTYNYTIGTHEFNVVELDTSDNPNRYLFYKDTPDYSGIMIEDDQLKVNGKSCSITVEFTNN